MIKHHAVVPLHKVGPRTLQQLSPIKDKVTRGVADAAESMTVIAKYCDINRAKRWDTQSCVLAKCLNRTYRPTAVSVARTSAFIVQDGIAVRFHLAGEGRSAVDKFDRDGSAAPGPITFYAPPKDQRIGVKRPLGKNTGQKKKVDRKSRAVRIRPLEVRALNGGKRLAW